MKRLTLLLLSLASLVAAIADAAPRPTAQALIEHFKMEQIPQEGPWFTLTYRSSDVLPGSALPERYDGGRVAGSAIICIVTKTDFSAMHRLKTDEIWHYYGGDPLRLLLLRADGSSESVVLGPDVLNGQKLQYTVPRDTWQGAEPLGNGADSYSMVGDTLAPGFEYTDFEMGYRDELQRIYPRSAEAIARLTRKEFATRPQPVASPERSAAASGKTEEQTLAVDELKTIAAAPGLELAEVMGRTAPALSERVSIAYFKLKPEHRTPVSYNRTSEEYFIVTGGAGIAHVGKREMRVKAGSVVVVPARAEHSLHATGGDTLEFYAVSAPAFSPDDYVQVSPPAK